MAGNGQATFQIGNYPYGADNTQRSGLYTGTLLITKTTPAIAQIVSFSITSNVLTLTVTNGGSFTTGGGDVINVQVPGYPSTPYSYLNGTYTTTSASATTLVMPLTHTNVATTNIQGQAYLQPTYTSGGIPLVYTFTSVGGGNDIPDLGSLPAPAWLNSKSLGGSVYNYKENTLGATDLLLIFNGATQLADAAVIPQDMVGFQAFFPRGFGGSGY